MKKSFTILMIAVLAFFTLPFNGITALADGKTYDNIKDGEYKITAKAMHATEDKASGAAGFINEDTWLSIKDGKAELTIGVPDNEFAIIKGIQVEDANPQVNKEDSTTYHTFKLAEVKTELNSQVQYEVPSIDMKHDVPFKFVLEGLDKLPLIEEGNEDEPEESGNAGNIEGDNEDDSKNSEDSGDTEEGNEEGVEKSEDTDGTGEGNEEETKEPEDKEEGSNSANTGDELIKSADRTYEVNYESDLDLERNFDNPTKLLLKDGKKYIQMNGSGGQFIDSLTINGEDVTMGEMSDDGNYVMQFEINGPLSERLDFYMKIDTGHPKFGIMEHDAKLSFDSGKTDIHDLNVRTGEKTPVYGEDVITVNGDKSIQLTAPKNVPEDLTVTINAVDKQKNTKGLKVAGEVYDFDFGKHDDLGTFELVMGYDLDKYPSDKYDVDIYHYNEVEKEWEIVDGSKKDGKITVSVNNFSAYGVFAKEKPEPIEKPNKTEEVDYTIMHKNGKDTSAADGFFKKPGVIFEKDGKQYAEVVIKNADMVKSLKSFKKEATIVEENVDDNSVKVQFQINNDLSATKLKMHIDTGFYDMEHEAFFVINEESSSGGSGEGNNSGQGTGGTDEKLQVVDPDKDSEKPNKLYTIDYKIMHENEVDVSAADGFFQKPGTLLEKDGKMYFQVIINNGDMIETLSSEYGDAVILDKKADGSILVQFRVNSDLSDTLLNMKINVPGLYSKEHKAILVFDKDSMVEGDVGDNRIVSSNDATPKKPEFSPGEDNGTTGSNVDKTTNPQTGDTTALWLYTLLLIGSLIPLAIKFRRRFN